MRLYQHVLAPFAPLACPTTAKWQPFYHEHLRHVEVSVVTQKPISKKVALALFEPLEADLVETMYSELAPRFERHRCREYVCAPMILDMPQEQSKITKPPMLIDIDMTSRNNSFKIHCTT
jgi:hypothetical protein